MKKNALKSRNFTIFVRDFTTKIKRFYKLANKFCIRAVAILHGFVDSCGSAHAVLLQSQPRLEDLPQVGEK